MSPVSNLPAEGLPPFSQYGILTGQLFLYAQGRAAFESSPPTEKAPEKKCILLGGLSDGLLPVPYTSILEQACHDNEWSLVQPILSSSYLGFGHGSLERDSSELEELIDYLTNYRNGKEFALVGHSTGCQDALYFLEHSSFRDRLKLVALQAPVSDREGTEAEDPDLPAKLKHSEGLVESGNGQEMLPRSYHWAPITAQRYLDLHAKGGRDDYFSSDYDDKGLEARLGHIASCHNLKKVLVAFSGADEYVPSHVDKEELTHRLVRAMNLGETGVAEALFLETGNHNLSKGENDAGRFVQRVSELLQEII